MEKKIIIIGAGISGATLANVLANKGWKVQVFEKNSFVGGNCFDEYDNSGILIHKYGPHIFHTNYDDVYNFINQFTKLNTFVNKVLVNVNGKFFPLPINFQSIDKIMGNAATKIKSHLALQYPNQKTVTLFELRQNNDPLIKKLVDWVSKNVYFNYSSKMWGVKFEDIDPNTINRVKFVLSNEHNYFPDDKYQGLPINGYTTMIKKMLDHPNIKLSLNIDAIKHLKFGRTIQWDGTDINHLFVYCGPLDELLGYKYGMLPYRSLDIKFTTISKTKYQDVAVVNYPADPKMTRIAEYKHMTLQSKKGTTTISKEYPGVFNIKSRRFNKRYYPIINQTNLSLYNKYFNSLKKYKNFFVLGRLSMYKYIDMDDAIKIALDLAKEINNA